MGRRRKRGGPHGVVVVDKPRGPTSHDVVARLRKSLGTRRVGHTGTLDPMATGVLVVAVGEGTKLVPHLTATEKAYRAALRLGVGTDTLDAEGEETERQDVPPLDAPTLQRAADAFLGIRPQKVPVVSAVRVDGERLHARHRRGETVEAPTREVELLACTIEDYAGGGVEGPVVTFSLRCGKGFYVRSLGRDLAAAVGTVGHLVALRRLETSGFGLAGAIDGSTLFQAEGPPPVPLMSLEEAWVAGGRPVVEVGPEGAEDALHGRPVALEVDLPEGALVMLRGPAHPLALARHRDGALHVERGFRGLAEGEGEGTC